MNIRRTRFVAILVGAALCSTLAQAQTPPKKAVTDRDPFVNLASGKSALPPHTPPLSPKTGPVTTHSGAGKPVATVATPAPVASVQGIIQSATGNRALVTTTTRTYLLKAGDKIGSYSVASVGAKEVVLSYKGSTFKLPMKSEFTAMTTRSTKKK